MTRNASFKQRVRARMATTGERYTTARARLLAATQTSNDGSIDLPPGMLEGIVRVGGTQADVAAAANVLAHAGATRADGSPIDEVTVFGLAGGIGFLYGVFEWAGYGPTLTLTTRTDSMPIPFIDQALARAGVTTDSLQTGGATTAAKHLDAHLEHGRPVLVAVDQARLPWRSGVVDADLGNPRLVAVVGRTDDGYLLDDQGAAPFPITADRLAAARASHRQAKHHAVAVTGLAPDHEPAAALLEGLRRTVADYDTPPAKPFAVNVGTRGLHKWADLLTDSGKRGWGAVFAEPAWVHRALTRTYDCVTHDLTAPGASRDLFAEVLDRAAQSSGLPALAALADEARAAAGLWRSIADVAMQADDAVRRSCEVTDELAEAADAGGEVDPDRVAALLQERRELVNATVLDGASAGSVFAELRAIVVEIADRDRKLLDALDAALP